MTERNFTMTHFKIWWSARVFIIFLASGDSGQCHGTIELDLWVVRFILTVRRKLLWWMTICFAWRRSSNIKGIKFWYGGKAGRTSTTVGWRNVTYWGQDERRSNWWLTRSRMRTNPHLLPYPLQTQPMRKLSLPLGPSTITGNQVMDLLKSCTLWKREPIFTHTQWCQWHYRHASDQEHGEISDLGIGGDDPTFQLQVKISSWPYPVTATGTSFHRTSPIISRYIYLSPNNWRVQDEGWDCVASLYLTP